MKINFETCEIWNGRDYVTIETEENFHLLFKLFNNDGFALFKDNKKQGWVTSNGEQIGGLHDVTCYFNFKFALFRDNGKNGCIDKYGFNYHMDVDDAQKAQEFILKEFPLGSMKFYIFLKLSQ